jgi:hypothetical protein
VYRIFPSYSSSDLLSCILPTPHWYPLHSTDGTCFAFLFSIFVKRKMTFHLFKVASRVFHCDISIYIYIITQIATFSLFFSFLSKFLSYGDFNRFENSILILV